MGDGRAVLGYFLRGDSGLCSLMSSHRSLNDSKAIVAVLPQAGLSYFSCFWSTFDREPGHLYKFQFVALYFRMYSNVQLMMDRSSFGILILKSEMGSLFMSKALNA
ncbi:hypothetical protein M758_11G062900 [Ceratodon purpureus]|nr:hypothetical protein M758_11G062900 [Ceratodon purpureus]